MVNERLDLVILNKTKYVDYIMSFESLKKTNIGTLYVKVTIEDLSESREKMIEDGFTTRLFVAQIKGENVLYVYGKKKGNKGTFNEHCKNTYYVYEDVVGFYKHIIAASSNEFESIFTDDDGIKNMVRKLKRIVS